MQCLCPLRHSLVRSRYLQISTALFAVQGPRGLHLNLLLLREIPIAVGKNTVRNYCFHPHTIQFKQGSFSQSLT